MSLPAHTENGQPISADALNRMAEEARMRSLRAGASRGSHVHQRGGGVVVFKKPTGLQPAPSRGGNSRGLCPFNITLTDIGGGDMVADFRPGTINSLLPDNYLAGVTVPATGTKYLSLECEASSGLITTATFIAEDDPPAAIAPQAGEPPNSFKILIGIVNDGIATKVWGCGNIQATAQESFRVQKGAPVAGQVPYDVYYTWVLSLL